MGADDRSKRDGFQTQKRKGDLAGQVRKEELLAKAVTIDGRKAAGLSRRLQAMVEDKVLA